MTTAANGDSPGEGGLPRTYLRACLLLLVGESPAHGYELLDHLSVLGVARTDPGGVYRALRSLEQEGLVASWWEHSGTGPARRRYRLTEAGGEHLEALARDLGRSHCFLSAYLLRHQRLRAVSAPEAQRPVCGTTSSAL